jgi:hypothetical protein
MNTKATASQKFSNIVDMHLNQNHGPFGVNKEYLMLLTWVADLNSGLTTPSPYSMLKLQMLPLLFSSDLLGRIINLIFILFQDYIHIILLIYVNSVFKSLFAYCWTSLMYANNPLFHLFAYCKSKTFP